MNTIEKQDEDTALQANQNTWKPKKQFKGRCLNCGIWGHKASMCRNQANMSQDDQNKSSRQQTGSRKPKFNGTCNYCGKFGHKKMDCYKLKNRTENEHAGTT